MIDERTTRQKDEWTFWTFEYLSELFDLRTLFDAMYIIVDAWNVEVLVIRFCRKSFRTSNTIDKGVEVEELRMYDCVLWNVRSSGGHLPRIRECLEVVIFQSSSDLGLVDLDLFDAFPRTRRVNLKKMSLQSITIEEDGWTFWTFRNESELGELRTLLDAVDIIIDLGNRLLP